MFLGDLAAKAPPLPAASGRLQESRERVAGGEMPAAAAARPGPL